MKSDWAYEKCAGCFQEFTLMGWVDRHDETLDNSGVTLNFHAECCPSCNIDMVLSEDLSVYE